MGRTKIYTLRVSYSFCLAKCNSYQGSEYFLAGTTGNVHKVSIEFCISAMFACSKYSAKQGVMKYNSGGFSFGRIVLRKTTRTLLPPYPKYKKSDRGKPEKSQQNTNTKVYRIFYIFHISRTGIYISANQERIPHISPKNINTLPKRIFVCVFFPHYSCSFISLLQNYLLNIYPWLGLCKMKTYTAGLSQCLFQDLVV